VSYCLITLPGFSHLVNTDFRLEHSAPIQDVIMSAGEFLQPWTAQTNKDYSQNKDYAVGVNIIVEWVANFTNATITLWQDNKPGDAQGGPSINLEGKLLILSISDIKVFEC
jgi:hypothetical protein